MLSGMSLRDAKDSVLRVVFSKRFVAFFVGGWLSTIFLGYFIKADWLVILTAPFALTSWILLLYYIVIWDRRKDVVVLRPRDDAPTFIEEHGQDIVKWSLIGLIPLAIVALISWLAGRF